MNEATNVMPGGAGEPPVSQPQTTPTAPQADTQAPAFDISTLDAELKATGALFGQEDWNHANARERLVKLRTTFSKQGQELNKLKELEPLRPFWQRMSEDDAFRAAMEEAVRSYQDNSAQMSPNQSAPSVTFNPVDARLNQLETVLRTQQVNAELDSLAAKNYPLNDDMREAVRQSVLSNPNVGTTENHYWMLFGPHIAQLRAQEAARASVEAIKVNNESFVQAPTRTAPPSVKVDVGSLSHQQEIDVVAKILGGGR